MSLYYIICCEAIPGEEENLDDFLNNRAVPFWVAQPGVRAVQVLGTLLSDDSRRLIIVEVADLEDLERIQSQREHRHLRREMLGYAARASSQIYYTVTFVSAP
ncbi:MAG TPA: hypothetical protein VNL95_07735 [Dehalococcoidia bacterium]|nr:hypothetical protein [Dehalococcoidia bacterium]